MTYQGTTCPGDAQLRAYLDDGDLRTGAHVAECPACRERLAELEANAAAASTLLARLEPEDDEINVSAALSAWRRRHADHEPATEGFDLMSMWNRRGARVATGIAGVFALLMVLTVSPMGSFAGDLLDRFRVQKFAAITINVEDFQDFQTNMLLRLVAADHEALGEAAMNLATFESTFDQEDPLANMQQFASADEARAAYGDFRTTDDLPEGYDTTPTYYVSQAGSATVTIDTAEAQAIIDQLNLPIYSLPDAATYPEMTFTMDIPQTLVQEFKGASEDERIFVAQLVSPTLITPEGLDMDALREDLLALPGLPPDFVAQLRSIDDWESTLIVPIPEGFSSDDVTIDGEPGLLITSDDEKGAVALWEDDGVLYIVGGTESGGTISDVAKSLD